DPPLSPEHQNHDANPLATLNLRDVLQCTRLQKHIHDLSFIIFLRKALLDNGVGLICDALVQLCNPPTTPLHMENPDIQLALENFITLKYSSDSTYEKICASIHKCYPDSLLLTLYCVKQILTNMTGVVPIVMQMCIGSCVAFTGPYIHLNACPQCHEPRYQNINGKQVLLAIFNTMPLGPQIQAFWRHPDTAHKMRYRLRRTEEVFEDVQQNNVFVKQYDDVFCGEGYLDAIQKGRIGPDDTLLMFSIDGAQLYENKESNCWIYIWIVFNLTPNYHYKKQFVLLCVVM
ncbi:hypothetical protein V8E55_006536, partial [Tylopilus felleus]